MLNSHKSKYEGKSYHNTLSSRPRNITMLALFCGLGLFATAKQIPHVPSAPCSVQIFLDFLMSCWTGTDACVFRMVFAFFIESHGFKSPGLAWILWICSLDHCLAYWEEVKWHWRLGKSKCSWSPLGSKPPRLCAHCSDIVIKFRVFLKEKKN